MQLIAPETLQEATDMMGALEEEALVELYQEFLEAQPVLFELVLSVEDLFEFQEDFSLLMQYVLILWQAFSLNFPLLPAISESDVDDFSEMAFELTPEAVSLGFPGLDPGQLLENQPHLHEFILREIALDEAEDLFLEELAGSRMMSVLLMVGELLNQVAGRPRMWVVK